MNGSAPRNGDMASSDTKEDQGINPGDELNKIEMIANRPTPDSAEKSKPNPAKCSRVGKVASVMAAS